MILSLTLISWLPLLLHHLKKNCMSQWLISNAPITFVWFPSCALGSSGWVGHSPEGCRPPWPWPVGRWDTLASSLKEAGRPPRRPLAAAAPQPAEEQSQKKVKTFQTDHFITKLFPDYPKSGQFQIIDSFGIFQNLLKFPPKNPGWH